MRRMLALVALLGLVQLSAGCRHVAGACDCDHSNYVRHETERSRNRCGGCGPVTAGGAAPAGAAATANPATAPQAAHFDGLPGGIPAPK